MMRTLPIFLIWFAIQAYAQNQPTTFTVPFFSDLANLRPERVGYASNAIVTVLNGSAVNRWPAPRTFYATNAPHAFGTNLSHCIRVTTNSTYTSTWYWTSYDADADTQNAQWFGMIGNGTFDNSSAIAALLKFATNAPFEFIFPRGIYRTTVAPISFERNFTLNLSSGAGGFATGWNPTNDVTESRLVYDGSPTSVFVDFHAAAGYRYGLNIRGLTFDANGLADDCVVVRQCAGGDLTQLRVRNAINRDLVLENSQYLSIDNFSSSANEIPLLVSTKIGLAFTNQANANVVRNATISGKSEAAIDISDRSKLNVLDGGGTESNSGTAIRIRDTVSGTSVRGNWQEANAATNWIQIDSGALHNEITHLYCENRLGRINVEGSHNVISLSSFGKLHFADSAGANTVKSVLLDIGELPTGNTKDQWIINVKDATALIETNIFPKNIAMHGQVIDFIDSTNAYPHVRIARDSIMFGDGLTGMPDVGIERSSALSLGFRKAFLHFRSGPSDGLYSAYVIGEAQPRYKFSLPGSWGIGPGGTNPTDINFQRYIPGLAIIDYGQLAIRSSTNDTLLSGYTTGSAFPGWKTTIDGHLSWGWGGTNGTDVNLYHYDTGALAVDGNLWVRGTNVFDAISARSPTNHLHTGVYDTNGAAAAAVIAHVATGNPHTQYVLNSSGSATNLTVSGGTLSGGIVATGIGSDLASAGAHRIIVRDATSGELRPMTAAYLLSYLDPHADDIAGTSAFSQSIMNAANLSAFLALIGSGTPGTNTYLRGDGAWTTPPSGGSATNGITDAPSDGTFYGRKDGAWTGVDIDYVAGLTSWGNSWISTLTDSTDALSELGLTGGGAVSIDSPAIHATRVNSGGTVSSRHRLNLIAGTGVSLSLSDDAGNDEADVTVSADVGQSVLLVTTNSVSITGSSLTDSAWHTILGGAKTGTSSTIAANTLTPGSVLKLELSGTMTNGDSSGSAMGSIRVTLGSSLTVTMQHSDEDSCGNTDGSDWNATVLVTILNASAVKVSGFWGYNSICSGAPAGLAYRAKAVASGTFDPTVSNSIGADFSGQVVGGAAFTGFECDQVIVTRY